MKSTLAVSALLVAANSVVAAIPDGVAMWDIGRRQAHPRLLRRGDTDSTTISNNLTEGGYFATCKMGTPAQTLTLQLDTGSSDIWAPDSSASICQKSQKNPDGCPLGSFTPSKSSTYDVVGEDDFQISYVDGSQSVGDYFTDVFTIGSNTLKNMTMGLGKSTDINFGLVGVGYTSEEAIVSGERTLSAAYPNLPVAMVNDGIIKTNAFSLWLNDLDASTGNILFGGIDTDKYKGDLTKIDIYKDPQTGVISSFLVALTSVTASSTSGSDTLTSNAFPVPVVLDSGTTLTYLPSDLAAQIWKEVGAEYSAQAGTAVIPCSRASSGGKLTFGLGGPNGASISVGMDELVLQLFQEGTATFSTGENAGENVCEFGVQNMTDSIYLLGDTFLRSAYVVYDLVNNQIALAATDFNATSSNIVPFESSGAPIPSATAAPSQSQVTQTSAVTTPAFKASAGFASTSTAKVGIGSSSDSKESAGGSLAVPTSLVPTVLVSVIMFLLGTFLIL